MCVWVSKSVGSVYVSKKYGAEGWQLSLQDGSAGNKKEGLAGHNIKKESEQLRRTRRP